MAKAKPKDEAAAGPTTEPAPAAPEPKKKSGPTYEDLGYPPEDGKRYSVGRKICDNPVTYKDFDEFDSEKDAKNKATDTACDEEVECMVWDRKMMGIIFTHKPDVPEKNKEVQDDTPAQAKPAAKPATRPPSSRRR